MPRRNVNASRSRIRTLTLMHHAQQAIEKLMKGLLIAQGVMPPRTHDLIALHELILHAVPTWSCSLNDLRALTLAAIQFRYPGAFATAMDAKEAMAAADRLRPELLQLLEREAED